jgi:hypothetical protein
MRIAIVVQQEWSKVDGNVMYELKTEVVIVLWPDVLSIKAHECITLTRGDYSQYEESYEYYNEPLTVKEMVESLARLALLASNPSASDAPWIDSILKPEKDGCHVTFTWVSKQDGKDE